MLRPRGKYTKIQANNPLATARCDFSGFRVRKIDLRRQQEFRGNSLAWTGFYVHKKFLDQPNPQLMTPLVMPDPIPVPNPRPDPLPVNFTPQVLPPPPPPPYPYPIVTFPGLN